MFNIKEWSKQANIIADVLSRAPKIDKTLRVGREEFQRRQKAVYQALAAAGFDGGVHRASQPLGVRPQSAPGACGLRAVSLPRHAGLPWDLTVKEERLKEVS